MTRERAFIFHRGNDVFWRWCDPEFWGAVAAACRNRGMSPLYRYRERQERAA